MPSINNNAHALMNLQASVLCAGCAVMQRVLDSAVPKFLQQLSRDYALWAEGNESRTSVASDELI